MLYLFSKSRKTAEKGNDLTVSFTRRIPRPLLTDLILRSIVLTKTQSGGVLVNDTLMHQAGKVKAFKI